MSRSADLVTALTAGLSPTHLEVIDESHMHSKGAESHFKVVVVSDAFAGLAAVKRHRLVNQQAEPVFTDGLHALSIFAKTPAEWEASNGPMASPTCLGGSKRDGAAS
jgi:BolA protein